MQKRLKTNTAGIMRIHKTSNELKNYDPLLIMHPPSVES